jgi:transposase InsO family protein
LDTVEYATLEWVDWFNYRQLLGPIGHVPPAEFEVEYSRQQAGQDYFLCSPPSWYLFQACSSDAGGVWPKVGKKQKVAHKKTDRALAVVTRRGYAVRRVAESDCAMTPSRGCAIGNLRADLLESVRQLVAERPTCDYRRIGAWDYVYVRDRPDGQAVLSQLSNWFEDNNEAHPHKALRLKSPREFIRSYLQPAACPVG